MNNKFFTASIIALTFASGNIFASEARDIKSLKKELNQIKKSYEKRISNLEINISKSKKKSQKSSTRSIYDNSFNPSVGLILNGNYNAFTETASEFKGFQVGEEGERGKEGFSIGESELNFSSNIDDKFYGSLTAAIVREDGSDKLELEEAYVTTTPGFGLPKGLGLKFGKALWNIGYLNEHHAHTDDFADRPLPYRVFLNKAYNDNGAQISYVLPTNIYNEIGGGAYRGDDFPLAGGNGNGNFSAYYRIGSDIGNRQNWRLGFSTLRGNAKSGESARTTGEEDPKTKFSGDSDLVIADFRYNFAPTGNSKVSELTIQAEYFERKEKGEYFLGSISKGKIDDKSKGWYAQTVYKFKPNWRIGYRYSQLEAHKDVSGFDGINLNANKHKPTSHTTMLDWTNSEYSRFRVQYSNEELAKNKSDEQFTVQYILSFGAHSAHKY